jgi:hypothetical protein
MLPIRQAYQRGCYEIARRAAPREMRHTFVSLLSSNGTALEDIADLVVG